MGDNEIVKALVYFSDGVCGKCDCVDEDLIKTIFDTLDLINRQKGEIEELESKNSNLSSDLTSLQNDLTSAKAEIERLEAVNDSFTDIGKLYSEIKSEAHREFAERSEKELFIKQNEHREHWMETLNRHRGTEAYKDYEWSVDNWLRGYGEAVQDILAINQNFLKELVGEDDG